jgi:hypothetical protein
VNGWAIDLSKIDRSLAKQPSYRNGAPTYNLLVFGPSAKTRLWLVLDGTDLYVDMNCDGELSAEERFERDGQGVPQFEVADKAGDDRYRIEGVQVIRIDRDDEKKTLLSTNVVILGKYRQYSGATPSARLEDAPVSHFHGPLTLDINRDEEGVGMQKLVTGDTPEDFNIMIGTLDHENGCWVVIENRKRDQTEDFPDDLHPVVALEFSPRQAGEALVRVKNPLVERC